VHGSGYLPTADGGIITLGGATYYNGWLAKLDPRGNAIWGRSFGWDGSSQWPESVAVGRCDADLYLGGTFAGGMTLPTEDAGAGLWFDSGSAPNNHIAPTWEMFLARFSR